MKRSKRFLSAVLVLCMVLSMLPSLGLTASAAATYTATPITDTSEIVAGGMYIFVENNNALIGEISNSTATSVASFNLTGLSGSENYVWTLEASDTDGQYYIKSNSAGKYLTNSVNSNGSGSASLSLLDTKSSEWAFSYSDSWLIQHNSDDKNNGRFLGRTGETSTTYKAYASGNLASYPHAFTIYKLTKVDIAAGDVVATLVTSADELFAGGHYLLVAYDEVDSNLYTSTLVSTASNASTKRNLPSVSVGTGAPPQTLTIPQATAENVYQFRLENTGDTWKFSATNGDGYLYKGTSNDTESQNVLRLSKYDYSKPTTMAAHSDEWNISFYEKTVGEAVTAPARIDNALYPTYHIRLNHNAENNGKPIFSSYTTPHNPVYLYRLTYSATECPVAVNIRCGEGLAYILKDGAVIASSNVAGSEGRAYVTAGDEVTLVMKPANGYKLSAAEMGSNRITGNDTDKYYWSWNDTLNAYTFTCTINSTSASNNYFNVSFLPRRAGSGITAVQATEIADGYYVITGISAAPANNQHDAASTYLLYGDDALAVSDNIGSKSGAVLLNDLGITLENTAPYTMNGLSSYCLYYFEKVAGTDYYTIRMCGATDAKYLACTSARSLKTVDTATKDAGAYWTVSVKDTGAATITTNAKTDTNDNSFTLAFNGASNNLMFRGYASLTSSLYEPILYQADINGYAVSYSKTGGGAVTAYNVTKGNNVASGSVQAKDSQIRFTFTPSEGYELKSASLNGKDILSQISYNTYTVNELDQSVDVVATFEKIVYNNAITVKYYVNNTLEETVGLTVEDKYYNVDLSRSVTVNGTSRTYADLTFSKAVNGDAEYTSVSDPILISDGNTINLYFLTTAVKLKKTATETTTPDANLTGKPNGGTSNGGIGAFSGTENNKDEHGNVKQTFEVNLHVQSSDMIPGYTTAKPTDIILVLDDSNSMFPAEGDKTSINNAAITKEAISQFLDVALGEGSKNRVAVVQYNTYASAWNGTQLVKYGNHSSLSEEGCFMSERAAVDAAVTAALTKATVNTDGATNTMGGFFMTEIVASKRSADTVANRDLVIIMFTDGEPTVRYTISSDYKMQSTVAYDGTDAEGRAQTSNYEYNWALWLAQQLRDTVGTEKAHIYTVALLGGSEYTDDDRTLARYLLDKIPKEYTSTSSTVYDIVDDVNTSSLWEDSTSYADAYFPVTGSDSASVSAELVDIFKQIAYTTVADSYITGSLTDTIPAEFKLTDASKTKLEEAGWTVTENADHTTTITKDNVVADKTGSNLTYEIEYQGGGVGSVFTNTSASFTYTDILTGTETTGNFAKPAVSVVAWTKDDEVSADIGVDRSIDVTYNDLFGWLTEGGYTFTSYKIRLTDKDGNDKTYYDAVNPQTDDEFDAFVDENSQTVSFYTLTPGLHTFYYVVEATVRAPGGTETTVYSRATKVEVTVTDLPTVNDADVVKAGEKKTINVLWNDTLDGGEGVTTEVILTDAAGTPVTNMEGIDIEINKDGTITYTTSEGADGTGSVYEFYYVVKQTSGELTLASQPTKVTVYSVESQYLVVDFGLTTLEKDYRLSSNAFIVDDITLDSELTVSDLALRTGENEYGTMTSDGSVFSFKPSTTNFNGVSVYEYSVEMPVNAYNQSADNVTGTVTVIPANNVYFEEDFISFTDGQGWADEGVSNTREQDTNNLLRHGYEPAYDAFEQTDTYSNGNEKSVTVSADKKEANGYFTFTGTGFDLYSECGPNSGVIVAEVYEGENTNGNRVKVILMDTYLASATYYQIPVIMCRDLEYKTYTVKLRAFYNAIFDHNYPAKTAVSDARVRALLGLDAETELVCLDMHSVDLSGAKTGTAPKAVYGQYNVYVDAVRIYNPLGTLSADDGIAYTAYHAANEENPVFVNINDTVIDAANTTGWANAIAGVEGILYLATGGESANAQDVFDEQTLVCLGAAGTINTETANGKDYVLGKDGKRIQYEGADVYVANYYDPVHPEVLVGKAFYYDKDGSPVQLNRGQLSTLNIYCYENKYDAIGPENEVYLKNGQGLAFKVRENAHIQISAKIPFGTSAILMAYTDHAVAGVNEEAAAVGWHTVEVVKSRTELYYDLTQYVNSDQTLILKCVTDEDANTVLSLCNFKGVDTAAGTTGAEPLMTVDAYTLAAAMDAFYPKAHTHSYTDTVTAPTCTERGYTTHTCECSEIFVDSYVDALGHDWDDGAVTLAPTGTEAGVKTYSCSRCSETYTEPLAPLGDKPCDGGEDCPSAAFTDVSAKDWYHLSIDFVASHDLMGGIGDGKFDPEGTMNRAMLVTVLWRCEGKPTGAKNPFTDVPAGEWYTDAVAWAAENGIVNGVGDGKFDPLGNVTREQIAVILCRYTEVCDIADTSKRGDLRGYPDVKQVSDYAADALAWAVGEGLILGSEGKLLPQGDATRAQVATILMRYLQMIEE